MPTAEVISARCKVKRSDSASAIHTIFDEGTNKPIPDTAEVARGYRKADFIVIICFLIRVSVCDSIVDLSIWFSFLNIYGYPY